MPIARAPKSACQRNSGISDTTSVFTNVVVREVLIQKTDVVVRVAVPTVVSVVTIVDVDVTVAFAVVVLVVVMV